MVLTGDTVIMAILIIYLRYPYMLHDIETYTIKNDINIQI